MLGMSDQDSKLSGGPPKRESKLQAYLIADAYQHGREMASLNEASQGTGAEVLNFVTDEISVLTDEDGKSGFKRFDLLAFRYTDERQGIPVLIELKSERDKLKSIKQIKKYSAIIDSDIRHDGLLAKLYSKLLVGEEDTIRFVGSCEKWIVWPAAGRSTVMIRKRNSRRKGYDLCVTKKKTMGVFGFMCGSAPIQSLRMIRGSLRMI